MNTEGSGFEAFCLYHGLKLHFTSKSYHYIKYNGKTNVSKDSFLKRKDKYSFYRLSRKYDILELKDYLISNFVYGKSSWIGEMLSVEAEEIYKKWMKKNQSLSYVFNNDVNKLLDSVDKPDDLFVIKSGGYPKILMHVMEENISLETFIILNDILNFFPMFDKKIQEDIIWPNFKLKCEKYSPFLTYDKCKYKKTLMEIIKENE
jgi:hypothetical protein